MFLKFDGKKIVMPYSKLELMYDNPYVSFPRDMTADALAKWGVFEVVIEDRPEVVDGRVAVMNPEPTLKDGVWTLGWGTTKRNNDGTD